jgi:hypothetical protein
MGDMASNFGIAAVIAFLFLLFLPIFIMASKGRLALQSKRRLLPIGCPPSTVTAEERVSF